jgi:hypothetical protein
VYQLAAASHGPGGTDEVLESRARECGERRAGQAKCQINAFNWSPSVTVRVGWTISCAKA